MVREPRSLLVGLFRYYVSVESLEHLFTARERNKDLMAKPAEITICSPVDPKGATGPAK
jgi:hypothetical protein